MPITKPALPTVYFLLCSFFFNLYSSNFYTQCGTQTYDSKIKRHMLYQLSQRGAPPIFLITSNAITVYLINQTRNHPKHPTHTSSLLYPIVNHHILTILPLKHFCLVAFKSILYTPQICLFLLINYHLNKD